MAPQCPLPPFTVRPSKHTHFELSYENRNLAIVLPIILALFGAFYRLAIVLRGFFTASHQKITFSLVLAQISTDASETSTQPLSIPFAHACLMAALGALTSCSYLIRRHLIIRLISSTRLAVRPSSVDPYALLLRARGRSSNPNCYDRTTIPLPIPRVSLSNGAPRNPMASLSLFPLPTSLLSTICNTCCLLLLHQPKHLLTLHLAMALICLCCPLPTPVPTSTFLAMISSKKLLLYIPMTLDTLLYYLQLFMLILVSAMTCNASSSSSMPSQKVTPLLKTQHTCHHTKHNTIDASDTSYSYSMLHLPCNHLSALCPEHAHANISGPFGWRLPTTPIVQTFQAYKKQSPNFYSSHPAP